MISKGLIEQTVYAEYALKISFAVWMNAVGKQLLVILVPSLIFRVRATQKVEVEKPEEFQPVQRKQLGLILGAIAGMLIPMIAVTYAPSEFTRKLVLDHATAVCDDSCIAWLCGSSSWFSAGW
ncbi:MAG: hypothetical protein V8S27_04740 [Lachnospiraceae bacterium]